jgi:hypothetical protein
MTQRIGAAMRSLMARHLAFGILLAAVLAVPVAGQPEDAGVPPPRHQLELQIPSSRALGQLQSVEVREALVVPTLSVFAGKSGFVRMRSGVFAPILVLASEPLGCGAVQQGLPPIAVMTRKGAAAMEARLASTRPTSTFAPAEFRPASDREFAFHLVGREPLDAEEIQRIERDATTRPRGFEALFGDAPVEGERHQFSVTQNSVWTPLLGGTTFRYDRSTFTLWRESGQLFAALEVEEPGLRVKGSLPLHVCPPLVHLHIEPK